MPNSEIFDTIGRHDLSASEKLVILILSTDGSDQLTQFDIAERTGLSRITVARAICSMRLQGKLPFQIAMAAAAGSR